MVGLTLVGGGVDDPPPEKSRVKLCWVVVSIDGWCYITVVVRLGFWQQLEFLLKGVNLDNDDFYRTNITLTIAVQNYILHTKRFS